MSGNNNVSVAHCKDTSVTDPGTDAQRNGSCYLPYQPVTSLNSAGENKSEPTNYGTTSSSIQTPDSHEEQINHASEIESKSETEPEPFTVGQLLILIALCISSVCSALFGSLLAPFFPIEASAKGASTTETGLIFGCYQLIVFLVSPFYGHFLVQIGWKFMFVAGILVCSSCAILYGFLEYCPRGTIFVVMCLAVRSMEALGGAASSTAGNAVAANIFSGRVSTALGILQACGAFGLMAGPPLGGVLYSAGGFKLPFFVTGSLYILAGLLIWRLLPAGTGEHRATTGNKFILFKIPIVYVVGFLVFVGQFVIGFLDVGLAIHLQEFKLSPALVGLVFLIPSGLVVLLAPLYGWISDKKGHALAILVFGSILGVAGFLLLGPSPVVPEFIPRKQLWVVLVGLVIAGIGWGSTVVCFNIFVEAAKRRGLPSNMETHGVISGTFNAFSSAGAFGGPVVGGAFIQQLKFPWASTVVASMIGVAGFSILVYLVTSAIVSRYRRRRQRNADEEREPLVS